MEIELKYFSLVLAGLLVTTCLARPSDPQPVKWYNVSLNSDPRDRWTQVLNDHLQYVPDIVDMINHYIPKELQPLAEQIGFDLEKLLPSPFAQEIIGIANGFGIEVGETVVMNIIYDLTAFCTSTVAQDAGGNIWHARNLDYNLTDLLRNLTVNVNFQMDGKTVYSAVTYAGYVGVLTGQKPYNFTITIDQRGVEDPDPLYMWIYNALIAILDKNASFVSFLIRQTLENSVSFTQAVDKLSRTIIHAPAYFIVGGVQKGEGVIITRDRLAAVDLFYISPGSGRWYVLETNYDHWIPPPRSDDNRSVTGHQQMDLLGQGRINTTTLFNVLSTPQVLNSGTTYTVVMSAAKPDIFTSWVRWPPSN